MLRPRCADDLWRVTSHQSVWCPALICIHMCVALALAKRAKMWRCDILEICDSSGKFQLMVSGWTSCWGCSAAPLPNEGSLTGYMPQALEARWSHASWIHGQIFSLGRFVTVLLQLTGCSVIHWRPFNLTSPRIWTRCPPKLVCLLSRKSRAAYLPDQIKSQSMHYGWKLRVWLLSVYMWCLTAEKSGQEWRIMPPLHQAILDDSAAICFCSRCVLELV